MRKPGLVYLRALVAVLVICAAKAVLVAVVHPFPDGEPRSADFRVTVEGQSLGIHIARVSTKAYALSKGLVKARGKPRNERPTSHYLWCRNPIGEL